MKRYEIWREGYRATGEHGTAQCFGWYETETWLEAVEKLAKLNPEFNNLWNREKMTYWGCSLFENEKDARERYG